MGKQNEDMILHAQQRCVDKIYPKASQHCWLMDVFAAGVVGFNLTKIAREIDKPTLYYQRV